MGNLNLLADDQILIGANLSTISAFKAGKDIKIVKSIPVISDLINDYFDGDISAINGIKVSQPGAPFSQAAWKAMRKISGGKVLSYSRIKASWLEKKSTDLNDSGSTPADCINESARPISLAIFS